jgi:hypothetical protein
LVLVLVVIDKEDEKGESCTGEQSKRLSTVSIENSNTINALEMLMMISVIGQKNGD